MSQTTSSSSGVGLPTILGVVFIVLKLTGVIAWSWLWVLAPFWIGFALFFFVFLLVLLVAAIATAGGAKTTRSRF